MTFLGLPAQGGLGSGCCSLVGTRLSPGVRGLGRRQ